MLKKLVASVVVLLGVAFVVAWFYLDRLVVDGIVLVGTEVLGTEVCIDLTPCWNRIHFRFDSR